MSEALKSFLAGWAGGVGLLLVGHPFDTIKTRVQADTAGLYKGPADCLKQLVAKEGPLAVYKGVTAPLVGVGTVFAVYFVSYDLMALALRAMANKKPSDNLSLGEVMVCGGFTGLVGTCILAPSELLKVQQQTAALKGLDGSMGAICRQIYAEQGARGFLKGFGATLARDCPGSMAWFGAYEMTKQSICEDPSKPTVSQALTAGGMGGMGMWLSALPMDTIKTRIQSTRGGKPIGFIEAYTQIMKEGGIKAFYKGFAPIMMRAFPANAACFACKEFTKDKLDRMF